MRLLIIATLVLTACDTGSEAFEENARMSAQCESARIKLEAKEADTEDGLLKRPVKRSDETDSNFAMRNEMWQTINNEIKALQTAVARCDTNER